MSDLYNSIPPEREAEYLRSAQEAVDSATSPVVEALGKVTVGRAEQIVAGEETLLGPLHQAEMLLALDARKSGLGDAAEAYAHGHDYKLGDFSTGIGDEAEAYLRNQALEAKPLGKPTYTHTPRLVDHLSPDESAEIAKLDNEQPRSTD